MWPAGLPLIAFTSKGSITSTMCREWYMDRMAANSWKCGRTASAAVRLRTQYVPVVAAAAVNLQTRCAADVQVQQSFTLMNASLNAFLSAVPVKYQRYRV
jgi:hypothetical protein